jgi:hypothetical protein
MSLSILSFVVLSVVALIAGVLRGFSGFGAGLLIAPVYSLFLSPTDVVVLIMALNLLTTVQLMPHVLRNVHWATVLSIFITAFIGVPIGVAALHLVDPVVMRRVIAGIVSGAAVLLLLGWQYKGRRGRLQDGLVGLFSGVLTSIGGVGGPPVVLYLISDSRLSQHAFRAIVIMLFFLLQLLTLAQIGLTGALTATQGIYVLMLLPTYVFANWLGERMYHRFGSHEAKFRRVALWSLLAIGVLAFGI